MERRSREGKGGVGRRRGREGERERSLQVRDPCRPDNAKPADRCYLTFDCVPVGPLYGPPITYIGKTALRCRPLLVETWRTGWVCDEDERMTFR